MHLLVLVFVGNDYGVGVELKSLLYQQVGIAAGTKHLDGEKVAVAAHDV